MLQLAVMCVLMGGAAFGCGMLPLAFAFSKSHVERLSAVGTGLLLGAALGVIVPEGIEATVEAHGSGEVPTTQIALALLIGFTFMLLVEQLGISGHSHGDSASGYAKVKNSALPEPDVEFDAELEDLEHPQSGRAFFVSNAAVGGEPDSGRERALPLTFGLVVHGLADGFALGASSLTPHKEDANNALPIVVFLALILHKAPTALALTTSLLASNLPRPSCKKYLAIFAAATPTSALITYAVFSILGLSSSGSEWTGLALLFSAGTFLYVATVLQPVSHHSSAAPDLRKVSRVLLIVTGLVIPFILSALLGHGH
ncbi:Zinc/iron permease [Coprinopsis sp. MPI-PUGE-AT-0042]|nr:Zinc/iron permease [Coprinopsis sp. MPI-PUGE-AT-0042]